MILKIIHNHSNKGSNAMTVTIKDVANEANNYNCTILDVRNVIMVNILCSCIMYQFIQISVSEYVID